MALIPIGELEERVGEQLQIAPSTSTMGRPDKIVNE